eukprot:15456291-Alexandrium_andersonii.AAC.1
MSLPREARGPRGLRSAPVDSALHPPGPASAPGPLVLPRLAPVRPETQMTSSLCRSASPLPLVLP